MLTATSFADVEPFKKNFPKMFGSLSLHTQNISYV